jgi:hypothetical protein
MVKASHKSYNGGADGLLKRLQELSSQKVAVGIPADEDQRDDSPIGNADLVYIHTHGVRAKKMREAMQPEIDKGTKYSVALQMYIQSHGSAVYDVPARKIIEPAIEADQKNLAQLLSVAATAAMDGEDTEKSLMDVGLRAQSKVRNWFTDSANGWPPNSPKTIRRKKSDKPLIDTGALRGAITFIIRGGKND